MTELEYWRYILDEYRKERKQKQPCLPLDLIDSVIAKRNIEWFILKGIR